MSKSISNNEIISNESNKTKTKQLTLFDFKSKSIKINKENEKPSSSTLNEIIVCDENENENKNTQKILTSYSSDKISEKKINSPKIKASKSLNTIHNNKYFDNFKNKMVKQEDNDNEIKIEKEIKSDTINIQKNIIGGEDVFREYPTLNNHLFSEIIMIIELYNMYIKLYERIMENECVKEDIKLSKIEFDKFIKLLIDNDNTDSNYNYFLLIIETLTRIILNNDKNLKHFGEKININNFIIQDLCRFILQNDGGNENNEDEKDDESLKLLWSNPFVSKKISVVYDAFLHQPEKNFINRKLLEDLHNIEFKKFNTKQKLDLISSLCFCVLRLDVFLNCFDELNDKISVKRSEIKEIKSKIQLPENEIKNKENKKSIENRSKKDQQYQIDIDKFETEINEMKNFLANCERKEPLGFDNENNLFWRFECLPDYIIREKINGNIDELFLNKNNDETLEAIIWYKYNIKTNELNNLINYLGKNLKQNMKLIEKLKTFKKKNFVQQIDGFLIKNEEKIKESVIEPSFNLRRSRRKKNIVNSKNFDSDDEQDDQPSIINIENHKKSPFDMYHDLEPLDALYNILNEFNKHLIESGLCKEAQYYADWKKNYDDGIKCKNEEEKTTILKKLIIITYSQLQSKFLLRLFSISTYYSEFPNTVLNCKTLSGIYLALRIFELNVKWWKSILEVCHKCKKKAYTADDKNDGTIKCFKCSKTYHYKCADITEEEIEEYKKKKKNSIYIQNKFICDECFNKYEENEEEKAFKRNIEPDEDHTIEINNYRLRRNKLREEKISVFLEEEKPKKRVTRNSMKAKETIKKYFNTESESAVSTSISEESRDSVYSNESIIDVNNKKRRTARKHKISPPERELTTRAKSLRTRSNKQVVCYDEQSDDDTY